MRGFKELETRGSGVCEPVLTSVAMCTFNGSQFLEQQLESIMRQTLLPDELVVCDDGSTDSTRLLLSEFARRSVFPVRLYWNQSKLGPSKNFEQAIELCKGQIIILSDQDDVWNCKKVETFWRIFESCPESCYAFSDAETINERGNCLEQNLWNAINLVPSSFSASKQLEILLKRNVITGAGLAFRSSFRAVILPIPEGWMHDYWIGMLGSAISEGVPISEVLYKYRRHSSQVCGWRKKSFLQVCKDSLKSGDSSSWSRLNNFRKLINRLQSVDLPGCIAAERMSLLMQKELHLLRRAEARSSRGLVRFGRVFSECSSGRYRRFSESNYSMVSDLTSGLF